MLQPTAVDAKSLQPMVDDLQVLALAKGVEGNPEAKAVGE
jgi:hypothetical protein